MQKFFVSIELHPAVYGGWAERARDGKPFPFPIKTRSVASAAAAAQSSKQEKCKQNGTIYMPRRGKTVDTPDTYQVVESVVKL